MVHVIQRPEGLCSLRFSPRRSECRTWHPDRGDFGAGRLHAELQRAEAAVINSTFHAGELRMMREIAAVISLTLAAACAMAQQQPAPAGAAAATPSPDADLTIHYKGPGVIAPELLSISGKFDAIDHCKKLDGDEQILIAVDRSGTPQVIRSLKSLGNDLDAMARHVVELDKFKPGTVDGGVSIVAVVDDITLQACRMEKVDESGHNQNYVQQRSSPEQSFELIEAPKNALIEFPPAPGTAAWARLMQNEYRDAPPGLSRIGNGVSAPVLIHQVDPQYTYEAQQAKFQGVCMVSIVVEVNGMPQNARVVVPLGMGLDEEALKAVKKFRFKPAMKDGKTAVPVMITVQVNFRLY